jgi:uncharacterized protein (DUF433 family)
MADSLTSPDERVKEMARLHHEEGLSLAAVGAQYGLTRERVRQLLAAHGYGTVGRAKAQQRRSKRRQEARKDELVQYGEEIVKRSREGQTMKEIAEGLDVPLQSVRFCLSEMLDTGERDLLSRKARAVKIGRSDEQMEKQRTEALAGLQQAAEALGEPLGSNSYHNYAMRHGLLGWLTIAQLFGSWRKACDLAGVKAPKPRRRHYTRIPLTDCVDAVASVWEDLGHAPSYEEYQQLARERGLPSGETIRNRFERSWLTALEEVSSIKALA